MKKRFLLILILCLMAVLPVAVSAMDYKHTLKAGDMTFSWSLDSDKIHVQLVAKTTGWVAVGFDPENAMQGANIIIGAVKNGKFKVEDHYGDRKRGHSSDKKLGGTNDVLDPSGSEADGVTTISFSFPLTTDDKYDKPVVTQGVSKVMLAYGAGKDSFKNRHPFRTIYEINLSTGENKKLK